MRIKLLNTAIAAALSTGVLLTAAPATASTTWPTPVVVTHRCEDTRAGHVCATLRKYPAGSHATTEARSFINNRYLPIDRYVSTTYLGWSKTNLTNGQDIWSVRSKWKPDHWHTYRIRTSWSGDQVPVQVNGKWRWER